MVTEEKLKEIDNFIGKKINSSRHSQGMSIKELAELISITEKQLQKYEAGTDRILANKLVQIAIILGKKCSYFFPE